MTAPTISRQAGVNGWAACGVLGVLAVASLFIGVSELSAGSLLRDPAALQLMLVSRLPRTLAAMLSGSALAIAGLVMQSLARNRFVEPATAGTVQSASLGILLVTLLWPQASIAWKSVGASLAALGGTAFFLTLVNRLPPTQPFLVPLFGLVYGGVVGAVVTFVAWWTDLLQYLGIWTSGEFSGVLRGRYELLWAAGAMVALAWWVADRLTILSLGKDATVGLGLSYAATLRIGLVIVSVVSAFTVVVVGMIPFVGLVVPNLVSRVKGENLRQTIPWVAGGGAALVLACDIIGRVIRFPYEIPVGTVLGVVGAVVFLIMLFSRRHHG